MAKEKNQQKSSSKDNPPSNAGQAARTTANKKRNELKAHRRRSNDFDRRHSFTPHGTARAKRRDAARTAWMTQDNKQPLPLSAFCT